MSDAGTLILIRRQDHGKLTDPDVASIRETVGIAQNCFPFKDAADEVFRFRLSSNDPLESVLMLVLSEYWSEGIDQGFYGVEEFEPLLDHDKQGANTVFQHLQDRLAQEFDLELICGQW